MPFLLILQIALVAAWYTIWPTLSAWVVFIPSIIGGVLLTVALGFWSLAITLALKLNK